MVTERRPRVVITGMGTINPLGSTLDEFYANLIDGKSGIRRWTSLDLSEVDCKVGGDLGDFDHKAALAALAGKISPEKSGKLRKMFRSGTFSNKLTTLSALYAFLDAGLDRFVFNPRRTSVVVAGHDLNHGYILSNSRRFLQNPKDVDFLAGTEGLDSNIAATVSEILGCIGPTHTVGGACASGNLALRDGYRDIVSGECERAVVAGAVFDLTAGDLYTMTLINAVLTDPTLQERPEACSRPFDMRRGGFIASHGAGTIILEELGCALERGAPIYGELAAVRACSNGNRRPSPNCAGQAKLISELLRAAGLRPEDVDYVNCHATSTKAGDTEEIEAIKQAFGPHAYRLKLNATKSMIGHTTWSVAIVETIAALLQMKHGMLHPSINIDELDPAIDLDVCANQARPHQIQCLLKNSFGFGGINCCSIIKRYEG